MNHLKIIALVFLYAHCVFAQGSADSAKHTHALFYDNDRLSASFHANRREALRAELPEHAMAVFFSNSLQTRSGDVDYTFHQDPNFYYLSGFTEPNSLLIIFKDTQQYDTISYNELLFIQAPNVSKEIWTGRTLTIEEARKVSGIKDVKLHNELEKYDMPFSKCEAVFIYNKKSLENTYSEEDNKYDLQQMFQKKLTEAGKSAANEKRLSTILTKLREVKQEEELLMMRKAITISCEAHKDLIQSLQPSNSEYEAQAIVEYGFISRGAECIAYPSIVGNSENSCVLHYTSNRKKNNLSHLLLTDAGAEYHGYAADITRTVPMSGTFTESEKKIYQLVLDAHDAAIAACKAGNKFYSPHYEAIKIIQSGLLKLGIIQDAAHYRNYFMHGTSHYLGLDVHDVGTHGLLKAGNVLTVEPGIYIPEGSNCDKKWWNIGVRIEDNILITDNLPENLSQSLVTKIEDIEALMKTKGVFEK